MENERKEERNTKDASDSGERTFSSFTDALKVILSHATTKLPDENKIFCLCCVCSHQRTPRTSTDEPVMEQSWPARLQVHITPQPPSSQADRWR